MLYSGSLDALSQVLHMKMYLFIFLNFYQLIKLQAIYVNFIIWPPDIINHTNRRGL